MSRNTILIHSREHLAELMSDCVMDDDEMERVMEYESRVKSQNQALDSAIESQDQIANESERTYDILKLETNDGIGFQGTRQDEETEDEIRNGLSSQQHQSFLQNSSQEEKMVELEKSYQTLKDEYRRYEEITRADTLNNDLRNNDEFINENNDNVNQDEVLYRNSQLSHHVDDSFDSIDGLKHDDVSMSHNGNRREVDNDDGHDDMNTCVFTNADDNNPLPNFKFRAPKPKFVQRNKAIIGQERGGSYSQQYLSKIAKNERKAKANEKQHGIDTRMPAYMMSNENGFYYEENLGTTGSEAQILEEMERMKHLRENLEISRLEEMIKAEEVNLKQHAFDLHAKNPSVNVYNHHFHNYEISPRISQVSYPIESASLMYQEDSPRTSVTQLPKKHASNYATIHSTQNLREKLNADESNSYAAQHLEKRIPHNYKKYGLKDYKALSKELKLNKSLGPDLQSEEYLEKKARTEKQKDYASLVAMHNRQSMAFKKSHSAPAPSKKDRQKDSKRTAALDYAKSIKNTSSRKAKKSSSQQRPATYEGEKMSAIEIMKQRHEAEKKAIDEMRQNLASIIKEVKS